MRSTSVDVGDDVAAWTPFAGTRVAVQDTGAAQPALADNYLTFAGAEYFDAPGVEGNIGAWIIGFRADDTSSIRTLMSTRSGNYNGFQLRISSGDQLEVLIGIDATTFIVLEFGAITPGADHVAMLWYDGSTVSLQLDDGTPVTQAAATVAAPDTSIRIGRYGAAYFQGRIYGVLWVTQELASRPPVSDADRAAALEYFSVRLNALEVPTDFGWVPSFQVYADGTTNFNFDPPPEGVARYIALSTNVPAGDDSNDGLTASTPMRTFSRVYQDAPDTVYILAGDYRRGNHMFINTDPIPNKPMAFIGSGGRAQMIHAEAFANHVWVEHSTLTNVWQTTRSAAYLVVDKSTTGTNNAELVYDLETSAAAVDANAGSYFIDGSIVYVRAFDDRAPDEDLMVFMVAGSWSRLENKHRYYFKDMDFWGHETPLIFDPGGNSPNAKFIANNCTFKYARDGNGLRLNRIGFSAARDCIASHNRRDGFNYHQEAVESGE